MSCPLNPMSSCNAPGVRCDRCYLEGVECSECGAEFELTADDIENEVTICEECRGARNEISERTI